MLLDYTKKSSTRGIGATTILDFLAKLLCCSSSIDCNAGNNYSHRLVTKSKVSAGGLVQLTDQSNLRSCQQVLQSFINNNCDRN